MTEIPIALCIDVEPDERELDRRAPPSWSGWDFAYAALRDWRDVGAAAGRPARFTWFLRLDPQIELAHGAADFVLRRDAARFRDLIAAGDGLGIHPHAFRWSDAHGRWICDHGDADWVDATVDRSIEVFRGHFGMVPRYMRYGDRFMSNRLLRHIHTAGIAVDVTLEPGLPARRRMHAGELGTGRLPDYRRVPRTPYVPGHADFRRPADDASTDLPWIVPISTAVLGRARRNWLGLGRSVGFSLNLGFPAGIVRAAFDAVLARPGRRFVVPVLRAGDLGDAQRLASFRTNLAMLDAHPERASFSFGTVDDLLAWWRGDPAGDRARARP